MGYVLKINGKTMPTPKHNGVTISENKIWSTNTGRSMNGEMQGTIIAIKKKAEIEFPLLTPTQVDLINNEVSNVSKPFIPVEITYPSGGTKTFNAYCGDVAYPVYGLVKGEHCVVGFKLDLIER